MIANNRQGNSGGGVQSVGQSRRDAAGSVRVPREAKRHLVVALAYFRAAQHRELGASEYRKEDEREAEAQLKVLLRRYYSRN